MVITLFILLILTIIISWQVLDNLYSKYLGEMSTLKLIIEEKNKEISNLKRKINEINNCDEDVEV